MPNRPAVNFPDSIAVRLLREVGDRLRREAAESDAALADVARGYLEAGIAATDAERRPNVPDVGKFGTP